MLTFTTAIMVICVSLCVHRAFGEPPAAESMPPEINRLVGGSWVGEGTWPNGEPFFARHVFERCLGGNAVRIRSYGRRDGKEIPLFETILSPAGDGSYEMFAAATFGATYIGSVRSRFGTIDFDYMDRKTQTQYGQHLEFHGENTYAWTNYELVDGKRKVRAEIEFHRDPLIPGGIDDRSVYAEVVVQATPAQVWESWTTPKGVGTFFARACNIDPVVGGKYEIYFQPAAEAGQRGAEGTHILALDPDHMLAFTWNAPPAMHVRNQFTSVVIRLEPVDETHTRVTLTNTGYGAQDDWNESLNYFRKAWPFVLDQLRKRFVDGPRKWPEDEAQTSADPAIAPIPYTAEAIRQYHKPGTTLEYERHIGNKITRITFHWTGRDEEFGTYEHVRRSAQGDLLESNTFRVRWEDLRQHAAFPAAQTQIEDEFLDGPAGRWDCMHYTVTDGTKTEHFWFAKSKPGMPVLIRIEQGDQVLSTMELLSIEHKDE